MLFFIIYKKLQVGGPGQQLWRPVYKSEKKYKENDRDKTVFRFNQLSLLYSDICGDDLNEDIKMEYF